MKLEELIEESHKTAVSKGWWDKPRSNAEAILLVITELCEAVEADRSGDEENFAEELADVYIRLSDLIGHCEIDIIPVLKKKMEYNKSRPYRHGRKY